MKAFRKKFRGRFVSTRRKQLNTMLRAFRQWGHDKRPVIAIVDWEGLPTAPEFEMFKTYFEANGVKTVICDPRTLEFRGGRLYANGAAVNLVYRRVLASDVLGGGAETRGVLGAYMAGGACVINRLRAYRLHNKLNLAPLEAERL